jgi:hypothetical protein
MTKSGAVLFADASGFTALTQRLSLAVRAPSLADNDGGKGCVSFCWHEANHGPFRHIFSLSSRKMVPKSFAKF